MNREPTASEVSEVARLFDVPAELIAPTTRTTGWRARRRRRKEFGLWRLQRLAEIGQAKVEQDAHALEQGYEIVHLGMAHEVAQELERGAAFTGELLLARGTGVDGLDQLHLVRLDEADRLTPEQAQLVRDDLELYGTAYIVQQRDGTARRLDPRTVSLNIDGIPGTDNPSGTIGPSGPACADCGHAHGDHDQHGCCEHAGCGCQGWKPADG